MDSVNYPAAICEASCFIEPLTGLSTGFITALFLFLAKGFKEVKGNNPSPRSEGRVTASEGAEICFAVS